MGRAGLAAGRPGNRPLLHRRQGPPASPGASQGQGRFPRTLTRVSPHLWEVPRAVSAQRPRQAHGAHVARKPSEPHAGGSVGGFPLPGFSTWQMQPRERPGFRNRKRTPPPRPRPQCHHRTRERGLCHAAMVAQTLRDETRRPSTFGPGRRGSCCGDEKYCSSSTVNLGFKRKRTKHKEKPSKREVCLHPGPAPPRSVPQITPTTHRGAGGTPPHVLPRAATSPVPGLSRTGLGGHRGVLRGEGCPAAESGHVSHHRLGGLLYPSAAGTPPAPAPDAPRGLSPERSGEPVTPPEGTACPH